MHAANGEYFAHYFWCSRKPAPTMRWLMAASHALFIRSEKDILKDMQFVGRFYIVLYHSY